MAKVVESLRKHKDFVGKIIPIFLVVYFLLIFAPYFSARFSTLNAFFTGGLTKIIYRSFTTLLFGLFSLLLWITNSLKINRTALIICLILLANAIVGVIIAPRGYTFSAFRFSMRWDSYVATIGPMDYVISLASFFFDLAFFLCLVSFIAPSLRGWKDFYPLLIVTVALCMISIGYSLIKEKDTLLRFLNNTAESYEAIRSLYHSKNSFGLTLFLGTISSIGLMISSKRGTRFLLLFPAVIFTGFSLIIHCRSSFLCSLFAIIFFLIGCFFALWKKNKEDGVVVLVSTLFVITLAVCVLTIPIFEKFVPFLPHLKEKLAIAFSRFSFNDLISRSSEWLKAARVVDGFGYIFGASETNAGVYSEALSLMSNGSTLADFHSGYVSWYASYGVIGLSIFCFVLCTVVVNCFGICKKDVGRGLAISSIALASLIYMLPETFTLFFSISGNTFILSVLLMGGCYLEGKKFYAR